MVSIVDSVLVVVISAYLFSAPYTKVEESFNIQAIHDILTYGFDISKFDHVVFPGAVPRTFISALLLSGLLKPVQWLIAADATDIDLQILARGVLGVVNALALILLKDSLLQNLSKQKNAEKTGVKNTGIGYWFIFFITAQFHLIFYASRTLPNFLVLPLTNYAFSSLIAGQYFTAVAVLSFSSVVFRIELLALTLSIGFVGLVPGKVKLLTLVKSAIIGGSIGALLSGAIDSYFWQRLTIPEIESFFFNVIEGKSELWGTEPFHAYFTKYLLTIFVPPTVLALQGVGLLNDPTESSSLKILGLSSLLYTIILSLQPHKELRFIIYVVPVFTLIGANGASVVSSKASKSVLYKFLRLLVVGSTLLSFAISAVRLHASSLNYPGAFALNEVNQIILKTQQEFDNKYDHITVHIEVPACMTGVTLFGELNQRPGINVTYDKTEDPDELQRKWSTFDFLITDADDGTALPNPDGYEWLQLSAIKGFAGLNTALIKSINIEFVKSLEEAVIRSKSLSPIYPLFHSFFVQENLLYVYTKVDINSKEAERILKQFGGY